MSVLSDKKRKRIEQIIEDHHLTFKVEVLGPSSIPKKDLDRLVKKGMVKLTKKAKRGAVSVSAAHEVGSLAARAGDEAVEKMSEETFWEYIKHTSPSLTEIEREAIAATSNRVGNLIVDLGDKVKSRFDVVMHEEDAKLRRLFGVRREVATGIARRKAFHEVATQLQRKLGDVRRDWLMIAHTEMHNALEEGKANVIINRTPKGADPIVFKRPRPDACPYCKLLYLDGAHPRLFRLSQLIANGTNHGLKAKRPTFKGEHATQWKAVIGATHPWCQCALHELPEGFEFDVKGALKYTGIKKSIPRQPAYVVALLGHTCA